MRRGPGRMRHVDMRQLWLQDEIREQLLSVTTLPSAANPADVFTKAVPRMRLKELMEIIGVAGPSEIVGAVLYLQRLYRSE
eukprot:12640760-Heterocapsa_arctica.AAC.1